MQKPEGYVGPLEWKVPPGYLDVTCMEDKYRVGIAGPDHPYYQLRELVSMALAPWVHSLDLQKATDKIMEVL